MKPINLVALAVAVGTTSVLGNSWLSQYHLIVSDTLTSVAEVEGRAVINQLAFGNSFNVGVNYSSPSSQINLAIRGPVAAGNAIQLNAGSLHVPGGATQSGNQVTFGNGRRLNLNGGGSLQSGAGTFNYDAIFTGIAAESSFYDTFAANSSLSLPSGQPGPATFNVGNSLGAGNVAVFNLSGTQAASLFDSSLVQQIDLNLNGANPAAILINVDGSAINYGAGGNFVGNFVTGSAVGKVMWNFAEATSIAMNKSFYGTVLAPKATLSSSGGALEGAVAVKNLSATVEVHPPLFAGQLPSVSPVPEASTWAAGLALAGVLGWQWRRR
jgi:choice-of-anchor A domain-containing protein